MDIGVIGVGGVGGYFGGRMCGPLLSRGDRLFFVARGGHLDAIRKNGLLLSTEDHGDIVCTPTLATDDFHDLPVLDICLLCVKSYDLPAVLAGIAPKVSQETLVLPLLNGVDIYERIRRILPTGKVFPACVYVGTHIERPGKVTQRGGACRILFGPDPSAPGFLPSALLDALEKSDIKHQWFADVYPEIWTKFIFIAAFGLVTAAFDKTTGQVMQDTSLRAYPLSVMEEIGAIARAKGIILPAHVMAETMKKAESFPYETKTSFQRDVERPGKPDERDLFGGAILDLGRELGIATPVTRELQERLEARKPRRRE